jgi:hypothetical protein
MSVPERRALAAEKVAQERAVRRLARKQREVEQHQQHARTAAARSGGGENSGGGESSGGEAASTAYVPKSSAGYALTAEGKMQISMSCGGLEIVQSGGELTASS